MKVLISRRYVISGRVQGVGFRFFAERTARRIGVTGWARNLEDGRVEVLANGTDRQLDEFEGHIRQGPRSAEVRSFEAMEAAVFAGDTFAIR